MRRALTVAASAALVWGLGLTGAAVADEHKPPTCEDAKAAIDKNLDERKAADDEATKREDQAEQKDQLATEQQKAADDADALATQKQNEADAADTKATEKQQAADDARADGNIDEANKLAAEAQAARDTRDKARAAAADAREKRDKARSRVEGAIKARDDARQSAKEAREKRDDLDEKLNEELIPAKNEACKGPEATAVIQDANCEAGGVNVALDNSKLDEQTTFEIVTDFGDTTQSKTVKVAAGETATAVAPVPTDTEGTITVTAGDDLLAQQTGILTCGTAGGGDDKSPSPSPVGDVEEKGSQLPFTGSSTGLIALIAGALIAAGAATLGGLKLARNRG